MVIAIGDLHLSNSRPWSEKVSNGVIDYILSLPYNNNSNIFVFLGDLTDKAKVDGSVTEMLNRLFYGIKAKETHVVMGNHEGEISNKKISLTYDFVENLFGLNTMVHIHREYKKINLEGNNCLVLPHVYSTDDVGLSIYSNLPKDYSETEYDFIFGHITDSRCTFPSPDRVDISYLKSRNNVLGHIHAGDPVLGYLGSVVPNSVSENDFVRNIGIINNGVLSYEAITNTILEYKEITYPDVLFRCKAKNVVWTVNNAQDPDLIRSHYGRPEMYIRKCNYVSNVDSEKFREIVSSNETEKGKEYFLEDWIKTKDISDILKAKIRSYSKFA